MKISSCYNQYIKFDRIVDYTPILSTAVNFFNIFEKTFSCTQNYQLLGFKNKRYFQYLNNKSFSRCFLLLIPFIGNFFVGVFDFGKQRYAENLYLKAGKYYKKRVPEYLFKAAQLYQKSADLGHIKAQNAYGWMLEHGEGTKKKTHLAVEYYKKAAKQGSIPAQFNLAHMLYEGRGGLEENKKKAFKYFQMAADQEDSDAQYLLGEMHAKGESIEKNESKALECFFKSADHGNKAAQLRIGYMYRRGIGGLKKDNKKALDYISKAAKQNLGEAYFELGNMYQEGSEDLEKDIKKTYEYCKKAANLGYKHAQYWKGLGYKFGVFDLKKDFKKAAKYFGKAASQGVSEAQFEMGIIYEEGLGGFEKDLKRAAEYFERAAEQGNRQAAFNLGYLYRNGLGGLEKNSQKADYWYGEALKKEKYYHFLEKNSFFDVCNPKVSPSFSNDVPKIFQKNHPYSTPYKVKPRIDVLSRKEIEIAVEQVYPDLQKQDFFKFWNRFTLMNTHEQMEFFVKSIEKGTCSGQLFSLIHLMRTCSGEDFEKLYEQFKKSHLSIIANQLVEIIYANLFQIYQEKLNQEILDFLLKADYVGMMFKPLETISFSLTELGIQKILDLILFITKQSEKLKACNALCISLRLRDRINKDLDTEHLVFLQLAPKFRLHDPLFPEMGLFEFPSLEKMLTHLQGYLKHYYMEMFKTVSLNVFINEPATCGVL